jgi:hypothetical protein
MQHKEIATQYSITNFTFDLGKDFINPLQDISKLMQQVIVVLAAQPNDLPRKVMEKLLSATTAAHKMLETLTMLTDQGANPEYVLEQLTTLPILINRIEYTLSFNNNNLTEEKLSTIQRILFHATNLYDGYIGNQLNSITLPFGTIVWLTAATHPEFNKELQELHNNIFSTYQNIIITHVSQYREIIRAIAQEKTKG